MEYSKRKYTIDEIWQLEKRGFSCQYVDDKLVFVKDGICYDLSAADISMIDSIINKGQFVVGYQS